MNISIVTSRASVVLLIICLLFSCNRRIPDTEIAQVLKTVGVKYAPDSRTALFSINYVWQGMDRVSSLNPYLSVHPLLHLPDQDSLPLN